jgi:cell division septum initiation protein DivIVA
MPELATLPRTPDGGYLPDAVAEAFAEFARVTAAMSAELKVVRAAAQRARTEQHEPDRSAIAAGVTAERIVRAGATFADELEGNARANAEATVAAAREEARRIISRAHDVTRELLRAASFGDAHLEQMTQALVRAASAASRE